VGCRPAALPQQAGTPRGGLLFGLVFWLELSGCQRTGQRGSGTGFELKDPGIWQSLPVAVPGERREPVGRGTGHSGRHSLFLCLPRGAVRLEASSVGFGWLLDTKVEPRASPGLTKSPEQLLCYLGHTTSHFWL
jgi:hypothetical protein